MRNRWSSGRLVAGVVLTGWATVFWFLMLSGRTSLYLASRTAWLVPVGAALLTIAAGGRLATARVAEPVPLARREAWALGLVALPVVLLLALPPATLGSYAVGRRSSFSGIGASARIVSGPLDFVDVGAAQSSNEALAALRQRALEEIELEGFVTHEADLSADEFLLTRFIITCCVADATIAQVHVVGAPPAGYADDEWVRVTGRVFPIGRDVFVAAESVEEIPQPSNPYLTP